MNKSLQFGRYKILAKLGQGGMGEVFKAIDPVLGREVALKIITSNDAKEIQIERFFTEAKATATIRHPNVITLFDIGQESGRPFYAMEIVTGQRLDMFMKQSTSINDFVRLMSKIAKAIACIHDHGIIHRDLKPSNIMMEKNGEPKIMDFGLAKFYEKSGQNLTSEGVMVGTLNYMSPEQANGIKEEIDKQTDIYSLGVILYQMLSGELPLESDTALGLLRKIFDHKPRPLTELRSDISPALEKICLQALEKDKNKRQQDAKQLAEQLDNYLAHAKAGTLNILCEQKATVSTATKKNTAPRTRSASRSKSIRTQRNRGKVTKAKNNTSQKLYLILVCVFVCGLFIFIFSGKSSENSQHLKKLQTQHVDDDKEQATSLLTEKKTQEKAKLLTAQEKINRLAEKKAQQRIEEMARKQAEMQEEMARLKRENELAKKKIEYPEKDAVDPLQKQPTHKQQTQEQQIVKRVTEDKKDFPQIDGFSFLHKKNYTCANLAYEVYEYRHLKTNIIFTLIPGGSFVLGTKIGNKIDEQPHKITLSPFLISKFEVTNQEWQTVMSMPKFKKKKKHPVVNVTWENAVSFCQKTGLNLPSEAQWEYAYFSGSDSKSKFYWGDDFSDEYLWQYGKLGQIGTKKPNAFGLHDMAGNAYEWCLDAFLPYRSQPNIDPVVNKGHRKIVRGGGARRDTYGARRNKRKANSSASFIGFRCVKNLSTKEITIVNRYLFKKIKIEQDLPQELPSHLSRNWQTLDDEINLWQQEVKDSQNLMKRKFDSLKKLKDKDFVVSKEVFTSPTLSLHGTKVNGEILKILSSMNHVKVLDLGHTRVEDKYLANIKNFANIEYLDLSETKITEKALNYLPNLKKLRILILSKNKMRNFPFHFLRKFPALEMLELKECDIKEKDIKRIPTFDKIMILDISENEIIGDLRGIHRSMPNLKELRLSKNKQLDTGNKWFLNSIVKMNLAALYLNKIQFKHPSHCQIFTQMKYLRVLKLDETNIDNSCVEYISKIKLLKTLDISETNIDSEATRYISQITTLKNLDLSDVKINNQAIKWLVQAKALRNLDLSEIKIDDHCVNDLIRMTQLKKLNIGKTNISRDGIDKVRKALKRCLVKY
ncbi:SUMF1/EgtB/PvdO family nonheme iron enzyme [Candidatus Uabimicrobium sp. HlEnr_7]|uniref:protein kinase domain-containing protein n=1 Tax=Candidatus Uabimicrobium helgolandensis TaxID=3095367 RepID=UPI003557F2C1